MTVGKILGVKAVDWDPSGCQTNRLTALGSYLWHVQGIHLVLVAGLSKNFCHSQSYLSKTTKTDAG